MPITDPEFVPFLQRAKTSTYAASENAPDLFSPPSRPCSHDLAYREGAWSYLDTYLGGEAFIGEEAVWKDGLPVWGMNYYGWLEGAAGNTAPPAGFSAFLKRALSSPPAAAPYRGPASLEDGAFAYRCRWEGTPENFSGDETITHHGQVIYRLRFHGGRVR